VDSADSLDRLLARGLDEDNFPTAKELIRLRRNIEATVDRIGRDLEDDQNAKALAGVVAQSFDTSCWSAGKAHLLPAELSTLYLLADTLTPDDIIVLLRGSSNPAEATLCWAMLERLRANNQLPVAEIRLSKPYALDPTKQEPFMEAISDLCVNELTAPFHLVLTGGYKGVMLGIAIQAIKLMVDKDCWKRKRSQGWNPIAYYLHEDSDVCVALEIFRLFEGN
jgi:hypothetical protein